MTFFPAAQSGDHSAKSGFNSICSISKIKFENIFGYSKMFRSLSKYETTNAGRETDLNNNFRKRKMNHISLFILCIIVLSTAYGQSPSFETYMNPIIPGDHSDCTLTKIGSDFYTTGSSFNPTPVLYHSTDLVHGEAIAQPVNAAWTGLRR